MTTIKLALNDQRLFALNKVTLASGDINSVQLEVEFCEAWADYPVRFAHFAVQTANRLILSSETDAILDVLMTDNKATIPATALAESGVLYVGVYGDSLDGTARKTSVGEVKFIIHKGASGAKTTIAPETDAFMQYLAAMDAKIDPLMTAAVEQMQNTMAAQYKAFTDGIVAHLDEFKNQYVDGVVLWECADIGSELVNYLNTLKAGKTELTIPIDTTGYSKFTVVMSSGGKVSSADGTIVEDDKRWRVGEIVKNEPHPIPFVNLYNSNSYGRESAIEITIDNSGCLISNINRTNSDGYTHFNCVIAAVIGYKDPSHIEFE